MPRPKLPDSERRKPRIVRLTDAVWQAIRDAAAMVDGRTAADYVQETMAKQAARDLKRAKVQE